MPAPDAAARLAGRRVLAFAGIGRPEKAFETIRECGAEVVATRAFPDHYAFSAADLAALRAEAGRRKLTLVTTEKDLVRLRGADDVLALQAYLYACVDAEGDPSGIPPGPWDDWEDRHLDAVNIERAAMLAAGNHDVPPSMLRLAGLA